MFETILENVQNTAPIVHCITNFVTVNDCANIILATGGSPIMADDVQEAADITSISSSLVINMGTLNEFTIAAMISAGKKANEVGHPVVLDPVGVGASKLRNDSIVKLLKEIHFSVIRGNISEIKAVYAGSGSTKGVDADENDMVTDDNIDQTIALTQDLSKRTGAVIAISGAIDIVADQNKVYVVKNGHPMMSQITGTGCMLTTVIGSYCGANYSEILDSTAAAVCSMGLCGELAYDKTIQNDGGTSSFRMHLIDYMSKMNGKTLNGGIKIETR